MSDLAARVALAVAAVVSALAGGVGVLTGDDLTSSQRMVLLLVAVGAYAAAAVLAGRIVALGRLTSGVVLATVTAVTLAAVVAPPRRSQDLYLYHVYGRLVAEHGLNPYVEPPRAAGDDPAVERMEPAWLDTKANYGPLFVGLSSAGAVAAQTSPLKTRLFHQGLAAAALAVALALLWRWDRGARPLVLLGLNPVTAVIVNGGHNDLLVGVAVLAAVLLARDGRSGAAGVAMAAAALVKFVALLPAVGLAAWVWHRHGRRAAVTLGAWLAGITGSAYLAAGGLTALEPLREARDQVSRSSPWAGLRYALVSTFRQQGDSGTTAGVTAGEWVSTFAVLTVAAVCVLVVVGRRWGRQPFDVVAGTQAAYLLGAAYVLPWYAGWALPVAAAWRSLVSGLVVVQSCLLVLIYVTPPGVATPEGWVRTVTDDVLPAAQLAVLVALVVTAVAGVLRRPTPSPALAPA